MSRDKSIRKWSVSRIIVIAGLIVIILAMVATMVPDLDETIPEIKIITNEPALYYWINEIFNSSFPVFLIPDNNFPLEDNILLAQRLKENTHSKNKLISFYNSHNKQIENIYLKDEKEQNINTIRINHFDQNNLLEYVNPLTQLLIYVLNEIKEKESFNKFKSKILKIQMDIYAVLSNYIQSVPSTCKLSNAIELCGNPYQTIPFQNIGRSAKVDLNFFQCLVNNIPEVAH